MKILFTWGFWAWIFAMYGIAHTILDVARWLRVAPQKGLEDFWFGLFAFVIAYYGSAFLMTKEADEDAENEKGAAR